MTVKKSENLKTYLGSTTGRLSKNCVEVDTGDLTVDDLNYLSNFKEGTSKTAYDSELNICESCVKKDKTFISYNNIFRKSCIKKRNFLNIHN